MRQIIFSVVGLLYLTHCQFPPPTTSDDQYQPTSSPTATSQITKADRNAKVDQLQEEVDQLKGKLDVVAYELEQIRKQNGQALQDFDSRLSVVETQSLSTDIAAPSTSISATPSSSASDIARNISLNQSSKPQEDIDMWISNVDKGQNLDSTIENIRIWLEKNPKDSKQQDASYAIANGYFKTGDYPRAIQAFQTVVDEYPKSDEACDARYHQGLSFIKLGDEKNAKLFFQETVELCPKHVTKEKAQAQIKKITM